MLRVFISSAHSDHGFVARELVPLLQRHGLECKGSSDVVHPSETPDNWLESCDVFVLVVTPQAVTAENVKSEVKQRLDVSDGRLLPLIVRQCDWASIHPLAASFPPIDFWQDEYSLIEAVRGEKLSPEPHVTSSAEASPQEDAQGPRVFISHASVDRAFVQDELIPLLRDHQVGWWYSDEHIATATQWERSIYSGLSQCDWFLVVLTPASVASRWVKAEIDWWLDAKRGNFIPVVVVDCSWKTLHVMMPSIQGLFWSAPDARHKLATRLSGTRNGPVSPETLTPSKQGQATTVPQCRTCGRSVTWTLDECPFCATKEPWKPQELVTLETAVEEQHAARQWFLKRYTENNRLFADSLYNGIKPSLVVAGIVWLFSSLWAPVTFALAYLACTVINIYRYREWIVLTAAGMDKYYEDERLCRSRVLTSDEYKVLSETEYEAYYLHDINERVKRRVDVVKRLYPGLAPMMELAESQAECTYLDAKMGLRMARAQMPFHWSCGGMALGVYLVLSGCGYVGANWNSGYIALYVMCCIAVLSYLEWRIVMEQRRIYGEHRSEREPLERRVRLLASLGVRLPGEESG